MDDIERAAIFLLGKQVEKVVKKMTEIKHVTNAQVEDALAHFNKASTVETSIGAGKESYIRNTLVNALGEETASKVIDKAVVNLSGIESLQWQDVEAVSSMLRDEHPQIITVILTHLDSESAAGILSNLPDTSRNEVMRRISKIKSISPTALKALNQTIEESAKDIHSFKKFNKEGVKMAAEIINYMNSELENELIEDLTQFDEAISEKIQEHIFPFEKLSEIDKRSLQTFLRDVSSDLLVLALKGVEKETQDIFFSNMSERAAAMLKDDLEAKGPVQLSKVLDAQKQIVAAAQKMAKAGEIVLAGKGEEMV